LCAQLHV